MGMLEKLFGGSSAAITADMIRREIASAEETIAVHRAALKTAALAIATMSDDEHQTLEASNAITERAIVRLQAKVMQLNADLPNVVAAEQAAAKVAANEALRRNRALMHKANTKEAAALLNRYDGLASEMADIFSRLADIVDTTNALNKELSMNPVAEPVVLYDSVHRKHADRPASEQMETCMCWVHADGTFEKAQKDSAGNFKRPDPKWDYRTQRYSEPRLERREIVVSRTDFRPGRYEDSLASIYLPGGFAGSKPHWPRNADIHDAPPAKHPEAVARPS